MAVDLGHAMRNVAVPLIAPSYAFPLDGLLFAWPGPVSTLTKGGVRVVLDGRAVVGGVFVVLNMPRDWARRS